MRVPTTTATGPVAHARTSCIRGLKTRPRSQKSWTRCRGLVTTTYNGTSWSTPATIDSTRVLNSVACPSTTVCAAVDANGNALVMNGSTWSAASNIDGTTAPTSVSCSSTVSCTAADGAGGVLSYNGAGWSAATTV